MNSENILECLGFLRGETILYDTTGVIKCEGQTEKGIFYLTNYQIYFTEVSLRDSIRRVMTGNESTENSREEKTRRHVNDVFVPYGLISKLDKRKDEKIHIICKDIRFLTLLFENKTVRDIVCDIIMKFGFTGTPIKLFAFLTLPAKLLPHLDGWKIYDPRAEYERMGIPSETWRITDINKDYGLCDTYPSVLAVPTSTSDQDLELVAGFRSKGRLPVLSYLHSNKASLTRCSQPRVGFITRCVPDEELCQAIQMANKNAEGRRLCFMDARPRANAYANNLKGAGTESSAYGHSVLEFLGVENIHVMRKSYAELREICLDPTENNWLSALESTRWLDHISRLLSCASRIAQQVQDGTSVLVHCSDGWDRTPQLVSLSSLMLDPYYRTIKGFAVLVEKEWLSFGHRFALRCGHTGDYNPNSNQRSPIFLQFLDCVWQIMRQFPHEFQYNQEFLLCTAEHVYSCRFGTFMLNSEQERMKKGIKEKTESFWSHILANQQQFINPYFYEHFPLQCKQDYTGNVIIPLTGPKHVQLWEGYYFKYIMSSNGGSAIRDTILKRITEQNNEIKLLLPASSSPPHTQERKPPSQPSTPRLPETESSSSGLGSSREAIISEATAEFNLRLLVGGMNHNGAKFKPKKSNSSEPGASISDKIKELISKSPRRRRTVEMYRKSVTLPTLSDENDFDSFPLSLPVRTIGIQPTRQDLRSSAGQISQYVPKQYDSANGTSRQWCIGSTRDSSLNRGVRIGRNDATTVHLASMSNPNSLFLPPNPPEMKPPEVNNQEESENLKDQNNDQQIKEPFASSEDHLVGTSEPEPKIEADEPEFEKNFQETLRYIEEKRRISFNFIEEEFKELQRPNVSKERDEDSEPEDANASFISLGEEELVLALGVHNKKREYVEDIPSEKFTQDCLRELTRSIPISQILKMGNLVKRGARRRNWTNRWFILRQTSNKNILLYFRANQRKPKGKIELKGCRLGTSDRRLFCFTLSTPDRTYFLSAKTQEELYEWLAIIKRCIDETWNSIKSPQPERVINQLKKSNMSSISFPTPSFSASNLRSLTVTQSDVNSPQSSKFFQTSSNCAIPVPPHSS